MWKKCQVIIGMSNIPQGVWTTRLTSSSGPSLGHIPIPCRCILHLKSLILLCVGKDWRSLVLLDLCGLCVRMGWLAEPPGPSSRPDLQPLPVQRPHPPQLRPAHVCAATKCFRVRFSHCCSPSALPTYSQAHVDAARGRDGAVRNIQRLHRCLPQRLQHGERPAVKDQMNGEQKRGSSDEKCHSSDQVTGNEEMLLPDSQPFMLIHIH